MTETKTITQTEYPELAGQLRSLNNKTNGERVYEHVNNIIDLISKGYLVDARLEIESSSLDKFDSIPDIKYWLIKNLYGEYKHPWEFKQDYYERMATKNQISLDLRLDKDSSLNGISETLKSWGYAQVLPPTSLTRTLFQTDAKFETVETEKLNTAVEGEIKRAEEATGKKYKAKSIVTTREQNQKEAYIFLKPKAKSKDIIPGFNKGLTVWTESDGTMVAKMESKIGSDEKESIVVTILKRQLPDIDGFIEEDRSGTRIIIEAKSSEPEYKTFIYKESHNWNLVFSDLKKQIHKLLDR